MLSPSSMARPFVAARRVQNLILTVSGNATRVGLNQRLLIAAFLLTLLLSVPICMSMMMPVESQVVKRWEKKTGRLTECPVPAFVETLQQRLLSHYGQETRPIPMDNCYQLGWDGRVVGLHLTSTGVSTLAELPGIYSLTRLSRLDLVRNTIREPHHPRPSPTLRTLPPQIYRQPTPPPP